MQNKKTYKKMSQTSFRLNFLSVTECSQFFRILTYNWIKLKKIKYLITTDIGTRVSKLMSVILND